MAKVKVINTNLNSNLNGVNFNNTASQIIFSFGRFAVTSNFEGRRFIDYRNQLSTFVRPVTLETLNLDNIQSTILKKESNDVVLNLDNTDFATFVRFGSAFEFLRTTIESIIVKYPGSLFVNAQTNRGGNVTYSGFTYNPISDIATFKIPTEYTVNNFGLVFNVRNTAQPDGNRLKNINLSYSDYVIWSPISPNDKSCPIIGFTGSSNGRKYLTVQTLGNPFEGIVPVTTQSEKIDFHLKPNNVKFEEFRAQLNNYEEYILSQRNGVLGFEFKIKNPTLLEDGTITYSTTNLNWSTSDGYNVDFRGSSYQNLLNILLTIGKKYDTIKSDLIARFLTPESIKTYDLTQDGKMLKLLRIYGREFDQMRQFIDSLVNINRVTYDKINNTPDLIIKNIATTLGWDYFSLVNEEELIKSFLSIDDKERNLKTDLLPPQIDIELWRRIIMNTNYFWKSKGTCDAIKSMFLMIGIPEPFINITEYVYTVEGKINPNNVDLLPIDFPSESYPFNTDGYPIAPPETNEFYFQISGNTDRGRAYMDNFRLAGFKLKRTVDNKKSWVEAGSVTREHYSTNQYYQEDSKLVLNTKEVDVALDTARGIEYDVYNYIQEDFKINSSGFTIPFNYVNISLGVTGSQSTFTLPYDLNKIQGDFEVRYNGILLNAPKTGDTTGTGTEITEADYTVSGNTFTLSGGNLAYNNLNRRDVIQATLITSGDTQPISGISIQYLVTRINPNTVGTIIPLPSEASGDVQVTINGIALTKGTPQFNADYVINPSNASEIIIQNPDVISYLANMNQSTTNAYVQVAYVNVTGSTSIAARNEIFRIDSFLTSKLFFNSTANRYVYKLNYKTNSVENIKVLIDGIALEPNTDYNLNPINPFEIYLPKGLKYGSVISVYYLIAGDDFFNPVISDIFNIGDISDLSFLEFLDLVQRKMINARSRKTITDFKGGWYPTLLNIYDEYLRRSKLTNENPLQSNGYTFQNLYPFLSKYNSFFQKFITQLLPATIILGKSGLLVRNSLFSRQKFTYKRGVNFDSTVNHFGDDGSLFFVKQEESVISPSVETIEGISDIYNINGTGGENIVMFDAIQFYGMEYKESSSITWLSQPIPPYSTPLTGNSFSHNITGLTPSTQYDYRAYISVDGITKFYGEIFTTTTQDIPVIIPDIFTKQGTAGIGTINNTGGEDIIRWEDIEWYAMQYRSGTTGSWITTTLKIGPLVSDTFNETITGLIEGQLYQYRAYMIVDGVEYFGQTRQITTLVTPTFAPTVETGTAASVTTSSFSVVNNQLVDDGGTPISQYGTIWTQNIGVGANLCYDLTNYAGQDTVCGTISGGSCFNGTASPLIADRLTWFRAFAENCNGTGHGVVKTQLTCSPPVLTNSVSVDIFWCTVQPPLSGDGFRGCFTINCCDGSVVCTQNLPITCSSIHTTLWTVPTGGCYYVDFTGLEAYCSNAQVIPYGFKWCDSQFNEGSDCITSNFTGNNSISACLPDFPVF